MTSVGSGRVRPVVVAHRGNDAVAPANTMPAFEGAWRSGADMLEIDVRLSSDGVPVVIHDATVDATTTSIGAVADLTADELGALDAGTRFSPVFANHGVPRLSEVAELIASRPEMDLLLEIKGDQIPAQAAAVLEVLAAAGITDRTVVQTFSHATIRALRSVDFSVRLGLLCSPKDDVPQDDLHPVAAEVGAWAYNPRLDMVQAHPELVDRAHAAGMRVFVWTLNDAAAWASALELGVDGIISDRPDRLAGWLSAVTGRELSAPAVL